MIHLFLTCKLYKYKIKNCNELYIISELAGLKPDDERCPECKAPSFKFIKNGYYTTSEFYRQLCVNLGLEVSYKKTIMFKNIQDYLYSMSTNQNIHCMICLDEAQYLNSDILKDLKMLCNFCMDSKNCFSLLLLGQPILNTLLMRQPNEALRQRISVNYSFAGLSEKEAFEYINNWLLLAGTSGGGGIFDDNAMTTAFSGCNSSIRQLNLKLYQFLAQFKKTYPFNI